MADDLTKVLPKSAILTREDIKVAVEYCRARALQHEVDLWDPEKQAKIEAWARAHPRVWRALQTSARFWLQSQHTESPQSSTQDGIIDVEKLEEMNLSDEKLMELAGIKEKK